VNHFHVVAIAKFGVGHFAVYGAYRLNDLFKAKYNYPELPPLTAGIEIGIY
jgi:hypothetical protein